MRNASYSKGNFGFDQNLVLLGSLCAFVLAFMFGSAHNRSVSARFEIIKNSNIILPDSKLEQLAELATLPDLNVFLNGTYRYLINYKSGHTLRGSIDIDDLKMQRSISVNHHSMLGSAEYEIVGSTVQYKNIKGDRYLFSDSGSVIGNDSTHGTFVELDGDIKLFVETEYTQDDYKPLERAGATTSQKMKNLTIWFILQWACVFIGFAILLYVLLSLINQNKKRKNPSFRA